MRDKYREVNRQRGRGKVKEEVVPVLGVGFIAPAVAAGVAAAAEVVAVGVASVVVVVGAAADDEDSLPVCAFCFLDLRRAHKALRPFLTCAAASGARRRKMFSMMMNRSYQSFEAPLIGRQTYEHQACWNKLAHRLSAMVAVGPSRLKLNSFQMTIRSR